MKTYQLKYAKYLNSLSPEQKEAEMLLNKKRENGAAQDEPAKKKKKKENVKSYGHDITLGISWHLL